MDFFAAQDRARRKSRWLVFWFLLAVLGIVASVYFAVSTVLVFQKTKPPLPFWDEQRFFWICLSVLCCIATGTVYKIIQLSLYGGALIATQMGGRMVARRTSTPEEQRLINVTEEMAIAAGIPAPVAYVLDDEVSLNAFAAGFSTRDGIVCVTRGLLDTMDRDELQGVIGHEISHIVNGDSRLNLRLTGVIHGIYFMTIIARSLMRARGRNSGGLVLLGVILFTIGYIGLCFGKIIQAAVSREREYLADFSSVQFTRNPIGLAAALKKLRTHGSKISHPEAVAVSHFFFSAADSSGSFYGLLATHPPLIERIVRLGVGRSRGVPPSRSVPASSPVAGIGGSSGEKIPPASVSRAQRLLAKLPEDLRQRARHIDGAIGIVGGLFFSNLPDVRLRQEGMIPPASLPVARELHRWLSAQPEQGARYRLVWLDIALPVLREASERELREGVCMVEALIRAHGRSGAREFALYSLLRGTLFHSSKRRVLRGELRPDRLDGDISDVLALIAHAGGRDGDAAAAAYKAAMEASPVRVRRPLPDRATLVLSSISRALEHLALASPPYRKKVLHACAVAVRHDGEVTPVENELIRAFAQSLDCPAPLVERPGNA